MYVILIVAVVMAPLSVWWQLRPESGSDPYYGGLYTRERSGSVGGKWFGLTIVVSFITLIFTTWLLPGPHARPNVYTTYLVAINDTTNTTGRIGFLGGGYIDESWVYAYYRRDDSGGYVLDHVDADYATIFEWDKPYAILETHVDDAPVMEEWTYGYGMIGEQTTTYYEFHVPPNSVTRDITFDLEK
jgi:hypothetical protein